MRSVRPVVAIAVATALLAASDAFAAQYPAWGDTGWVYASKRDCCDGAVQIAQEYSAQACYTAGGVPRPTTGTRRGVCQWDTTRDPWGRTLFRCQAEATLWCR